MTSRISVGMAALNTAPHALYRFYDASDVLLYVGITMNLPTRMIKHKDTKPWWTLVADIQVEHFATREEALRAERKAIRDEHPLYNEQHNRFVTVAAEQPDPGRLYAACQDCGELLTGGDGVLHVDQAATFKRKREWVEFDDRRRACGSWAAINMSELMSLPEDARWRLQCDECAECGQCYDIEIGQSLTWALLLGWTAHLAEKDWLRHTDWFRLMQQVAHGTCKFLSATPIPVRKRET